MSQVEHLLDEISRLPPNEVAVLYNELAKRVSRLQNAQSVLTKYRGRGSSVWPQDEQTYINQLRSKK